MKLFLLKEINSGHNFNGSENERILRKNIEETKNQNTINIPSNNNTYSIGNKRIVENVKSINILRNNNNNQGNNIKVENTVMTKLNSTNKKIELTPKQKKK